MQSKLDNFFVKGKPNNVSSSEQTDTTSTSATEQQANLPSDAAGPNYFDLGKVSTEMISQDKFKLDLLATSWDASKFSFPMR